MDAMISSNYSAANAIAQNYTSRQSSFVALAQKATPDASDVDDQSTAQSQYLVSMLQKTVTVQAAEGNALTNALGQGQNINVYG
jgi:hypothetical protein